MHPLSNCEVQVQIIDIERTKAAKFYFDFNRNAMQWHKNHNLVPTIPVYWLQQVSQRLERFCSNSSIQWQLKRTMNRCTLLAIYIQPCQSAFTILAFFSMYSVSRDGKMHKKTIVKDIDSAENGKILKPKLCVLSVGFHSWICFLLHLVHSFVRSGDKLMHR